LSKAKGNFKILFPFVRLNRYRANINKKQQKETKMIKKIFKIPGIIISIAAIAFLCGWVTMLLWNWLMPVIFNLPVITFWQSFGLIILAKLVFGGMHPHHGRGCFNHKRHGRWHRDFKSKYDSMSNEEKETFKAEWKKHFDERFNECFQKSH
jgi:hypothetical protein